MTIMQETYQGKVIKGDGRGKTIGYPTANIDISNLWLDIKPGVYSSNVITKDSKTKHPAILFLGPKKTFDRVENTLEIHILNFSQDIYNQTMEFTIENFIREPVKFNSVDELVEQIQKDIKQIS